jgi:hypothetical protein
LPYSILLGSALSISHFGLSFLPQALPVVFAKLLGHSIDMDVTHISYFGSGTTMIEPGRWLGEVWMYRVLWPLGVVLPAGFLWALVNLIGNKNRPLNVAACLAFGVWFIRH